jgi:hypothetical protein
LEKFGLDFYQAMNKMEKAEKSKTRWHLMLGTMFEELLTPVGIKVYTDFPVMADRPMADILLLRKETPEWTPEQLARLSDGVRDCGADHILIEFKYTESVGVSAFRQAAGYDYFYNSSKQLTARQARTFLVSSKTVKRETLDKFSYFRTDKAGVLQSQNPMLEPISLLILNDLSKEPHNAYIKCFASLIREKEAAFGMLSNRKADPISAKLTHLLEGLMDIWFSKGGIFMEQELTPEKVIERGKMLGDLYLKSLPPEERLKGLGPEEVLKNFKPEEVLKNFKPEERLKGLSAEEIEAYLRKLKKNK